MGDIGKIQKRKRSGGHGRPRAVGPARVTGSGASPSAHCSPASHSRVPHVVRREATEHSHSIRAYAAWCGAEGDTCPERGRARGESTGPRAAYRGPARGGGASGFSARLPGPRGRIKLRGTACVGGLKKRSTDGREKSRHGGLGPQRAASVFVYAFSPPPCAKPYILHSLCSHCTDVN
jgi:hypothetical protein